MRMELQQLMFQRNYTLCISKVTCLAGRYVRHRSRYLENRYDYFSRLETDPQHDNICFWTTTTFENAKRKRSDSIVASGKSVIQVFFDKNYNAELSQHSTPRSLEGNNKTIVSNIRQYVLHMNSKVIMFPPIKRIWLSYKLYNFQYC